MIRAALLDVGVCLDRDDQDRRASPRVSSLAELPEWIAALDGK